MLAIGISHSEQLPADRCPRFPLQPFGWLVALPDLHPEVAVVVDQHAARVVGVVVDGAVIRATVEEVSGPRRAGRARRRSPARRGPSGRPHRRPRRSARAGGEARRHPARHRPPGPGSADPHHRRSPGARRVPAYRAALKLLHTREERDALRGGELNGSRRHDLLPWRQSLLQDRRRSARIRGTGSPCDSPQRPQAGLRSTRDRRSVAPAPHCWPERHRSDARASSRIGGSRSDPEGRTRPT